MQAPTAKGNRLEGYAIRYNSESKLINERGREFREIILPGALRSVLTGGAQVLALWNHGSDGRPPLGRTPTTLRLFEETDGLRFELDLPNSAADVREAIDRGDVNGMSFAMGKVLDRWSQRGGVAYREISEIGRLREISPVIDPAYGATSVHLRCAVEVPEIAAPPSALARAKYLQAIAERR